MGRDQHGISLRSIRRAAAHDGSRIDAPGGTAQGALLLMVEASGRFPKPL
jgi:hypothetical protein